tara:strand:- start:3417 stop:5597 length:2181 start_codon:yes stop_codon:yes gene_type:complete
MCHEKSFIDFTQFNSALIVGKIENNELYSNGVGKTTIFKAIEYVLFNQADVNLDKIIRDETDLCKVTLDFIVDSIEYRVSRIRTKKGNSDLSLYERNSFVNDDFEIYHLLSDDDIKTEITKKEFWKDISGRRAADTEKELSKLIKYNLKSFKNIIHFQQNAFDGLATATPEKRKMILKDVLDLTIYSKLEKVAKDKANSLLKDIEKLNTIINYIGNPKVDLLSLNNDLLKSDSTIENIQNELNNYIDSIDKNNIEYNNLLNESYLYENKFSAIFNKELSLKNDKSKLEISIKEYTTKKNNLIKSAKDLINDVLSLKEDQSKLSILDFSKIDLLSEEISIQKNKISEFNIIIKNNLSKIEELNIPLPDDNLCKHCRQDLSAEHKNNCLLKIKEELNLCNLTIKECKNNIIDINSKISYNQNIINKLILSKQELDSINSKISLKNNEIQDKKNINNEFEELLVKFNKELLIKISDLSKISDDIKEVSARDDLKLKINNIKINIDLLNKSLESKRAELNKLSNSKAILVHSIEQKNNDLKKLNETNDELKELRKKYSIYPSVIQSFSSIGIPNLIIQNVLDDLQIESNNLLSQLKPGLQLSFLIEKIKGDGSESDTLDIKYNINGKERYYEQLSGAMKIAVAFSLKLGLSFLLQKIIGVDIKFLLLDEIDQSLDKASVDAFADIVKFFQKDFVILIITHNDRLKDKFSHAILVEQNVNMVSRAKVVSSW